MRSFPFSSSPSPTTSLWNRPSIIFLLSFLYPFGSSDVFPKSFLEKVHYAICNLLGLICLTYQTSKIHLYHCVAMLFTHFDNHMIYLYHMKTIVFFIHSLTGGYLDCSQVFVPVNSAMINLLNMFPGICVRDFSWVDP